MGQFSNTSIVIDSDKYVTIKVNFTTTPSGASSSFTDLKYNKQCVFNFEADDQAVGIMDWFAYINGGFSTTTGLTYSGYTFSDGCGNSIKWRAALGVNCKNNFNNSDWGVAYPGCATWTQRASLINNDWMIQNHSYYHNRTGNYYYPSTWQNTDYATNYIYTQLNTQGVQYITRCMTVPNNDNGFTSAANNYGYLSVTSQGSHDGYTLYPSSGGTIVDFMTLPNGFVQLNRNFSDSWTASNISTYSGYIDNAISGSSASVHQLFRLGTHFPTIASQGPLFDHLNSVNTSDKIWVTTMQEMLEYREIKYGVVKTEIISGNQLTILLDLTNISLHNRFRDMTLKVTSDASISSVSVSNADSYSYNATTGLINVFKKKLTFLDPSIWG